MKSSCACGLVVGLAMQVAVRGDVLTVGAGRQYATIEQANSAAHPGDRIEVYPAEGDGVYSRPAVYVTKAGLTFRGKGADGARIVLDGTGFEYSGVGSTPRAIFQVNRAADGVTIENFELRAARNASHNGAGVRINQANGTIVRGCEIHDNQMGIMSNGAGDPTLAADQWIEYSAIHHNGDYDHPGFNHNLYLGGTSVTMQFCEVHASLTGHNVKSRAHFSRFQYNFVHDAANREFDLVDDRDTIRPNAHAVLLGNFIVKKDPIDGNTNVIHFGQDGGNAHDGTLFMISNTVVTPHFGPILYLSAPQARAELVNNVFFNPRQNGPLFYRLMNLDDPRVISGHHNWVSVRYDIGKTSIDPESTYRGAARDSHPGFLDVPGGNYRLAWPRAGTRFAPARVTTYLDGDGLERSGVVAFQYRPGPGGAPRDGAKTHYLGAGVSRWPTHAAPR